MLVITNVKNGSIKSNKIVSVHNCARHVGAHAALVAKTCPIIFVVINSQRPGVKKAVPNPINMGNEKQRRESVKSKLTNDLEDANKRFKQAKTDANVAEIKSIRNEMKDIKEQLEDIVSGNDTRNMKAEVEHIQQEIEIKESKIKEFIAQFDHEYELYQQCDFLIIDLTKEIKKTADEEDEYDEERLDELGGCKKNVIN